VVKNKKLIHEFTQKGYSSIIWNGDNDEGIGVGSGIYFYQLKVGKRFFRNKEDAAFEIKPFNTV